MRRIRVQQPDSKLRPQLLRSLYRYQKHLQAQPDAYLRAFFQARPEDLESPFFSHLPRWKLTLQVKGLLSKEAKAELAAHDPLEELRARLPREYAHWHPFAQAQHLENTILLPGYNLSSQGDQPAMGQSIDGRYPFLDARVMDWAARLPPRLKMNGLDEKHVLKRAAREFVPPAALAPPKQPYRASDAASFVDPATGKSRYPWVDEMLSSGYIAKSSIFDPGAVGKLVEKVRGGTATGVKDDMTFVSVLSAQLVQQQFVDRFESTFPAHDLGFFVKGGDGLGDVKPIAQLYKQQVYALAAEVGVPEEVRKRRPTTDTYSLPQSQDEFYFSLPYEQMDLVLWGKNHGLAAAEVASGMGLKAEQIERDFKDIDQECRTTRYLHMRPQLIETVSEVVA